MNVNYAARAFNIAYAILGKNHQHAIINTIALTVLFLPYGREVSIAIDVVYALIHSYQQQYHHEPPHVALIRELAPSVLEKSRNQQDPNEARVTLGVPESHVGNLAFIDERYENIINELKQKREKNGGEFANAVIQLIFDDVNSAYKTLRERAHTKES